MHIRRLPGERAIRTANYGEVDGELIRRDKISQAYPNLIIVPVTIITIDFVVFTKEKRFPVKGWESLIPYRVGHRHGVKTVETNLAKSTKSQPVATLEQAFRQLDIGRNDVVVDTLFGGLVKLSQLGMKNIVVLDPPLIASPQYHYLHIKNKKLLAPLTAVLRKMEEKGVIRQIQQRVIQDLSSLQERENSKLETSAISFMGSG
jgi:polar amino acid transport system substrate-binding protein